MSEIQALNGREAWNRHHERNKVHVQKATALIRKAFNDVFTPERAYQVIRDAMNLCNRGRPQLFIAILDKCVQDAPREVEVQDNNQYELYHAIYERLKDQIQAKKADLIDSIPAKALPIEAKKEDDGDDKKKKK